LLGIVILMSLFIGVFLYSQFNPEDVKYFPKCPVYTFTGYKCPGCGSQRAIHQLLHGNIYSAFKLNPFIILMLPYMFTGIYIEYIADKTHTVTAKIRSILFGKWAIILIGIFMIIYTIARNIAG